MRDRAARGRDPASALRRGNLGCSRRHSIAASHRDRGGAFARRRYRGRLDGCRVASGRRRDRDHRGSRSYRRACLHVPRRASRLHRRSMRSSCSRFHTAVACFGLESPSARSRKVSQAVWMLVGIKSISYVEQKVLQAPSPVRAALVLAPFPNRHTSSFMHTPPLGL